MHHGFGVLYCIAFSRDPYELGETSSPSNYNGTPLNYTANGLFYYVGNYSKVLEEIKKISEAGYPDDIKCVFSFPSCAFYGYDDSTITNLDDKLYTFGKWITTQNPTILQGYTSTLTTRPNNVNGYVPKNKKLLQWPFIYFAFTPYSGEHKIYRYENFINGQPRFRFKSEIAPNPNVMCSPFNLNYKSSAGTMDYSQSTIVNGYPQVSYQTDYFSGWIAQNQELINLDLKGTQLSYAEKSVSEVGKGVSSLFEADWSSAVESGISLGFMEMNYDLDIQKIMANKNRQEMLPNSGTIGTGSVSIQCDIEDKYMINYYSIKNQFAKRIDNYFEMFGYMTNELKIPNISNRNFWNYVKTTSLNIVSKSNQNVPNQDMSNIKNIFNNGVTLWHNPAYFLDYSQNNH